MVNSLNETVELMTSSDYKERFKAEYYQLELRYLALKKMLADWDNGSLSFTPASNREIYNFQLDAMSQYMNLLSRRAKDEEIDL